MELYTLTIIDWIESERISTTVHTSLLQAQCRVAEEMRGQSTLAHNYSIEHYLSESGHPETGDLTFEEIVAEHYEGWLDWLFEDYCLAVFIEKHILLQINREVEPVVVGGEL